MGMPIPLRVDAEASGNSYSCICCNKNPRVVYVEDKNDSNQGEFRVKESPRKILRTTKDEKEENKKTWAAFERTITRSYPKADFPAVVEKVTKHRYDKCLEKGECLDKKTFKKIKKAAKQNHSSSLDESAVSGEDPSPIRSDMNVSPAQVRRLQSQTE